MEPKFFTGAISQMAQNNRPQQRVLVGFHKKDWGREHDPGVWMKRLLVD
jgi:hypothetical protein